MTVSKSSKIDPYKMVSAETNARGRANPMVRAMVSNVAAVNNLGRTVNSIGAVVVDIKKINLNRLEQEKKNRVKFKPNFTTPKKKQGMFAWLGKLKKGKIPGFIESLLNMLAGLLKLFVILPIMKWIANPDNKEKILKGVEVMGKMLKILASIAKFGTNNMFNGLYNMLADESSWWDRLVGFGQFLVGFGTLALAFRWLNPLNILTTVKELRMVVTLFGTAIKAAYVKLSALTLGPLGWMFLGAAAIAVSGKVGEIVTDKIIDYYEDDPTGEKNFVGDLVPGAPDGAQPGDWFVDSKGQIWVKQKFDSSNGGWSKASKAPNPNIQRALFEAGTIDRIGIELPAKEMAKGGWIQGPQSGYPVSVDGMGPNFIGHGTEYVAGGKSDGSSYIIPFDTKATRSNPNLTKNRLAEATRMGYDVSGITRAIGGMVDKKMYLHWTGSAYNQTATGRYHSIFSGAGKKTQNSDYDATLSHTFKRNKNAVGLAIAAMGGRGWDEYPPTSPQLINMMKEAARIGMSWGMKPGDVTRKNVMTQAEAASNRDGGGAHENYGPVDWGGTGERWGLWKLRKNDPDGSGGDRLRSMMKSFMQLPGKRKTERKQMDKTEFNLLQRLILAEARGEGTTGMSLVARAVLQRQALIRQTGNPGMFNSKGESITDVIMGEGQFQPVRDGSIDGNFSEEEYKRAAIAIRLAQNSRALRDKIMAQGYDKSVADNLIAATGFRTKSAFEDPSQNVNKVKYGNHIFNTAGNTGAKDLLAQKANDKYAGDGPGVPYQEGGLRGKRGGQEEVSQWGGSGANKVANVSSGRRAPRPTIGRTQDTQAIKKQTEDRNRARREMNAKTLQIVQQALAAVEKSNNSSRAWVAQANSMAQQVLSSANTPKVINAGGGRGGGGGGGGGGSRFGGFLGTAVQALNSFNNPLRGIFG